MKKYVIIDADAIQNRIEELEKAILLCKPEQQLIKDFLEQELFIRREILSQSTPLIPEIEKTWEHGYTRGYNCAFCEINHSDCLTPNKQDYISNLKLNI